MLSGRGLFTPSRQKGVDSVLRPAFYGARWPEPRHSTNDDIATHSPNGCMAMPKIAERKPAWTLHTEDRRSDSRSRLEAVRPASKPGFDPQPMWTPYTASWTL